MADKAIYTSAQRNMAVSFNDIVGYNEKNQPIMRKNVYFRDGMLILDLSKENDQILERLLDEHPLNIKNKGSISTGFKKQNVDEMTRAQAVANGEVYCREPEDGIQQADREAIEYLIKIQKNLPKTALKNTIEKASYLHDRFNLAGVQKPKDTNALRVIKARVVEILEALRVNNLLDLEDDDSEG